MSRDEERVEEQVKQGPAELWDVLRRDVRQAVRGLARRPGFTLVVVLTLALGIGANTAIFSFVNAVLLRPLPAPHLERLVAVYDDRPGINLDSAQMSPASAVDLMKRADLFEVSAAYAGGDWTLTGFGEPRRVAVTRTLGRYFDLFGATPVVGRLYGPESSEPGAERGVVLSHRLWIELTGGDRGIVGRVIELDGVRFPVAGVAAPTMRFPRSAEIWMPFELTPGWLEPRRRGHMFMDFVGRLRPGITHEQLAAQLRAEVGRWAERLPQAYPAAHRPSLVHEPLVRALAGRLRQVLTVLMGAVAFLLLIACANVGSLQLLRATGRAREIAVRTALGASRGSIVRQLFTESLVLAGAGGAVGLLVGWWTVKLLSSWDAVRFEALRGVRLDPTVLAFAAGATVLSATVFGVAPALRAARVDPQDILRDASRGSSGGPRRQRGLRASVVVQLALSLVLLLGSALMVSSLSRLLSTDPGFRAERVMTMRVDLPQSKYESAASRTAFFDALGERLRGAPGVQAVGMASSVPFGSGGQGSSSPFTIVGIPKRDGEPERHADMRIVGAEYFRAMGIPLLRGRSFDRTDGPIVPGPAARWTAVIDEALARKYFDDVDPIGRVINQGTDAVIVGVVGGVRDGELGRDAYPSVYYSQTQLDWLSGTTLVVRSTLDDAAVIGLARAAVGELDRDVPLHDIASMGERVSRSLGTQRLAMTVLVGFAALSLLLAVLGVYGVVSYGVRQRTREIGIRIALGARPTDVVRMVVRGGMLLAVAGAAVGVAIFLGVGGALSSLLYGVGARDPAIVLGGVGVLALVAAAASWWPARRAARVSPMEALRAD